MRLWSVHPRYLDRQGLTACWREGLLAQAVIGTSRGYSNHPQLLRFRACEDAIAALGAYLSPLVDEAEARGYSFARDRIRCPGRVPPIPVTEGQLAYEWERLLERLQRRSPEFFQRVAGVRPQPHPVFTVVPGGPEDWERGTAGGPGTG